MFYSLEPSRVHLFGYPIASATHPHLSHTPSSYPTWDTYTGQFGIPPAIQCSPSDYSTIPLVIRCYPMPSNPNAGLQHTTFSPPSEKYCLQCDCSTLQFSWGHSLHSPQAPRSCRVLDNLSKKPNIIFLLCGHIFFFCDWWFLLPQIPPHQQLQRWNQVFCTSS